MTDRPVTAAAVPPDVAAATAAFGVALHSAGLPVGPDRCERLARAVAVMNATSMAISRWPVRLRFKARMTRPCGNMK